MILDASGSAPVVIDYIVNLFNDLKPIIFLIGGIGLGIWIIEGIVGAIRK